MAIRVDQRRTSLAQINAGLGPLSAVIGESDNDRDELHLKASELCKAWGIDSYIYRRIGWGHLTRIDAFIGCNEHEVKAPLSLNMVTHIETVAING